MKRKHIAPELPKKKSLAESIDILLVRAEFATTQRHKVETQAELDSLPVLQMEKVRQPSFPTATNLLYIMRDMEYRATLNETLKYYEGHLNALRKILEGQFKPEE